MSELALIIRMIPLVLYLGSSGRDRASWHITQILIAHLFEYWDYVFGSSRQQSAVWPSWWPELKSGTVCQKNELLAFHRKLESPIQTAFSSPYSLKMFHRPILSYSGPSTSWPNVPVWPGQSRFRARCPGVLKGYVRDAFMSRFTESRTRWDRGHHLWLSSFQYFINAIVSQCLKCEWTVREWQGQRPCTTF